MVIKHMYSVYVFVCEDINLTSKDTMCLWW